MPLQLPKTNSRTYAVEVPNLIQRTVVFIPKIELTHADEVTSFKVFTPNMQTRTTATMILQKKFYQKCVPNY
jgi:hypothetical protein